MTTDLTPKAAEIASHTRALLAAGGYNSFSYANLSELVRISKASIHHHFSNKAKLVETVVVIYRQEARQGMAMLDLQFANDAVAELNAYAEFWATCLRDETTSFCICAMLASELPALPEEIAKEVRGHFDDLATWLAAVLQRGVENRQLALSANPVVEAQLLMATVHGAMLAARAHAQPDMFKIIVQPAINRLIALN